MLDVSERDNPLGAVQLITRDEFSRNDIARSADKKL